MGTDPLNVPVSLKDFFKLLYELATLNLQHLQSKDFIQLTPNGLTSN